jgi:hypothetical protein
MKILRVFESQFIDQITAIEIVEIVLDFLSFCKNKAGCQPPLKTTFTE